MKWKTLDYKEIQVPRGQEIGLSLKDETGRDINLGGHRFKLLKDSQEHFLNIAFTQSWSETIENKDHYLELCRKVVELTGSSDVYNRIGKLWKQNNNMCFVIVYKKKIIYKSDWQGSNVWYWTPTENLDMTGTKAIL